MANHNYSLWSVPALLIAVVMITVGTGASISAQAAEISQANQKKIEIRKQEEARLKQMGSSYNNQAKTLAKQYKNTAKLVMSQHGDTEPLLGVSTYFDNEAK